MIYLGKEFQNHNVQSWASCRLAGDTRGQNQALSSPGDGRKGPCLAESRWTVPNRQREQSEQVAKEAGETHLAVNRCAGQLLYQFDMTFPWIQHFVVLQSCLRLSTQDRAKVSSLNRGATSTSNNEGRVFMLLCQWHFVSSSSSFILLCCSYLKTINIIYW